MSTNPIVVGTDGSGESLVAVRWAAREASRRRLRLQVVLAYEWSWPGARFSPAPPAEAEARGIAELQVAEAVAVVREVAAGVEVTGRAVRGLPAQTLMNAARDASLLVVGSRGHGGFVNLLLGSISLQVATHATGPVVVVRGHADTDTGPIVVGVDSSPAADEALGAAFEAAVVRGAPLIAVRAYELPMAWGGYGVAAPVFEATELEAAERQALVETLAPWQEKYPNVPVELLVGRGSAADVLAGVSRTAQLIVVGTRGHGGFAGLLLGSVGQQLLHHAESPVLIARRAA